MIDEVLVFLSTSCMLFLLLTVQVRFYITILNSCSKSLLPYLATNFKGKLFLDSFALKYICYRVFFVFVFSKHTLGVATGAWRGSFRAPRGHGSREGRRGVRGGLRAGGLSGRTSAAPLSLGCRRSPGGPPQPAPWPMGARSFEGAAQGAPLGAPGACPPPPRAHRPFRDPQHVAPTQRGPGGVCSRWMVPPA